jgi:hypothetical protein
MSTDRSNDELDYLLAEGQLAGPVKDRILEKVLNEHGVAPGVVPLVRRRRLWMGAGGLVVAAAAAVVLVALPRGQIGEGTFTAKGAASEGASTSLVDVQCLRATLDACPSGATLVFGAAGAAGGFLAAYSEPASGGERIWYFSKDGESPALAPGDRTQPFLKAIRLGPEHAPGEFRIHLFVTRAPHTRAELLAGLAANDLLAKRTISLRVVNP